TRTKYETLKKFYPTVGDNYKENPDGKSPTYFVHAELAVAVGLLEKLEAEQQQPVIEMKNPRKHSRTPVLGDTAAASFSKRKKIEKESEYDGGGEVPAATGAAASKTEGDQ